MSPDEIRQLCQELDCSTRELADTLGIGHEVVRAWQRAEAFATKQHLEQLQAPRQQGPLAVVRKPRKQATGADPRKLHDPRLGKVVRALVEHPTLLDQVAELVDKYESSPKD